MNKKKYFLFINTILVIFIFAVYNYLIFTITDFEFHYSFIIIFAVCIGLYFLLNKPLIDDIFDIERNLKQKIETTMHEINTPISTIQINSKILSSKITDIKNSKRLDKIDKACDNLIKLYEDMEYYIKKEIEDVKIVSFDLKKLIYHCVEKHTDFVLQEGKKININIQVQSILTLTDKHGLEIIIDNLISNAIKHNKTITNIDIYLEDAILHISDDGDGIKSQNIYKIFDKYYQINSSIKGFGVGLAIVKEFCDKYKIDIKINSSTNGTTFSLNLKNILEEEL